MSRNRRPIILLIEDDPSARGAPHVNHGKARQLEYACVAQNTPQGPMILVQAVRNATTHEDIDDPEELPPLAVVIEAARLYDWSWINQQVFNGTTTTDNGPIAKAEPEPKPKRKPRRKPKTETNPPCEDDTGKSS